MKGLQFHGNKDIRVSDNIPQPKITQPDQCLLKVGFCGICGSDLHEYLDGPIFANPVTSDGATISGHCGPFEMGHEYSAEVVEIGTAVTKVKVGDKVCVEASYTCEDIGNPLCDACEEGATNVCQSIGFIGLSTNNGGLADFSVISERHVFKLPDDLPLELGALVEPLSVAWHAVKMSGFQKDQTALILGAGPIGIATILCLQAFGASRIIVSEPADIRRSQALAVGAHVALNPFEHKETEDLVKEIYKANSGRGVNSSFDCSGMECTLHAAIKGLKNGGNAINVAIWPNKYINFKPMDVTLQEKSYRGSICYKGEDFEEVIEALGDGRLDKTKIRNMITGKVHLNDVIEGGFDQLINNKDKHIKILATPNADLL
ncbi:GroES-like protein [Nadsonia fulvescens var. elongata DSM 6958]|uniref:GroES-like protein n=1 Tax=Nadsonia fulvescens var. elongata DSM 6958 TaxID=857566 RepID=A0A1E3PKZ9_9ASCO|nr:GroES-like protein [Nadsonia fulvescens var. elongata DSM 6958]